MCQHPWDCPIPLPASIQIGSRLLLSEHRTGLGGHIAAWQERLDVLGETTLSAPSRNSYMEPPGQAFPEGPPLAKSFLVLANWSWLFCHS